MKTMSSPSFVLLFVFCLVVFTLPSCSRHKLPKLDPPPAKEKRVRVILPAAPADKKSGDRPFIFMPSARERIKKIKKYRNKRLVHNDSQVLQSTIKFLPGAEQETVEIGGKLYHIPAVWRGRKMAVPPFSRSSLLKLPAPYVYGKKAVYVKKEVLQPLLAMMDAAALAGIRLQVETGYRDIDAQKEIFLRKFREGRSWEDVVRYVAPPGYSEHMLGLAVDFYPSGWQFATTKGYRWLQEHGRDYGFVESYPQTPVPGHAKIAWEAWHWFYTGTRKTVKKAPSVQPAESAKGIFGDPFLPQK